MNFRTVESTLGQTAPGKDGKMYQVSTSLFGTITAIVTHEDNGQPLVDKYQNPQVSVHITDDTGDARKATIRSGNKGVPSPNLVGTRCNFLLQPWKSKFGKVGFSGFCNGPAVQPTQRQALPQMPSKNFGAAPAKQDSPKSDNLEVRYNCAKAAAEIVARSPGQGTEFFNLMANHIYDWVMNKPKAAEQPAPSQDFGDFAEDNPQKEDELPPF